MTVLLRSLIVWLMLLALPYQGYASATMMLCVASTPAADSAGHAAMPSGPHDHAAMMATQAREVDKSSPGGAHHGVKCGGTACCAAAAPLATLSVDEPALPLVTVSVPFYSDFLPAVDLAHPDRPPQDTRA
jgi:hypothetical protein